jgi:hypothetical protein
VKSASNLWGSITCGQNLDSKQFRGLEPGAGLQNGTTVACSHRHRLDDDG